MATNAKARAARSMPSPARSARGALWLQSGISVLSGALVWLLHVAGTDMVPNAAVDHAYRAAASLAGYGLVLLGLTLLMGTQWRLLWLLLLTLQFATVAGLFWLIFTGGVYWAMGVALTIVPIVIIGTLTERSSRRWFNR
ncbi:hypothetical protein [Natronoglycomyces albus]|uniref:Uncharacterized protein n=1 Tax=Natronoglycomyces albus TaxID=2811108 RepID=A0A895XM19_9ACTN|nr:hypothetical protein [Natronoglycomyces albus]QSB04015.1 hypothetical protein JQS30_09280 [Natronoglycomyces albus]